MSDVRAEYSGLTRDELLEELERLQACLHERQDSTAGDTARRKGR